MESLKSTTPNRHAVRRELQALLGDPLSCDTSPEGNPLYWATPVEKRTSRRAGMTKEKKRRAHSHRPPVSHEQKRRRKSRASASQSCQSVPTAPNTVIPPSAAVENVPLLMLPPREGRKDPITSPGSNLVINLVFNGSMNGVDIAQQVSHILHAVQK